MTTHYTLLAHRKDGMQALVQHGNEQAAYLYNFRRQLHMAKSGITRTYERVPSDFTVHQDDWITDYDNKMVVPSTIQNFISGHQGV